LDSNTILKRDVFENNFANKSKRFKVSLLSKDLTKINTIILIDIN